MINAVQHRLLEAWVFGAAGMCWWLGSWGTLAGVSDKYPKVFKLLRKLMGILRTHHQASPAGVKAAKGICDPQ